jgi:hypothetical protein
MAHKSNEDEDCGDRALDNKEADDSRPDVAAKHPRARFRPIVRAGVRVDDWVIVDEEPPETCGAVMRT